MTDNEILQAFLKEQRQILKEELAPLKEELSNVKKIIEIDIRPSIQKIAEGHAGLAEKLGRIDNMADDIDEMKGSMVALEAAILKNSNSIIAIKKAQG